MKRLIKLYMIAGLLFPLLVVAQQKKTASTKYNFTEVWVWEYKGKDGKMGEMALYREPKLNYWLLTAEAYGNTDDMCDWILVQPEGTCYFAYKDAEIGSGGSLLKVKLDLQQVKTLPTYWKAGSRYQKFGNAAMGFSMFNGREYQCAYTKTQEQTTFYLARTAAAFAPLAVFNELDVDAKLPIRFPKDIPGNYVVLSEDSNGAGYSVQYRFKYRSHTEYHIDLASYKLQ